MMRRSLSNNLITSVAGNAFNDLGQIYNTPVNMFDRLCYSFITHTLHSNLTSNKLTQVPNVQNAVNLGTLSVMSFYLNHILHLALLCIPRLHIMGQSAGQSV